MRHDKASPPTRRHLIKSAAWAGAAIAAAPASQVLADGQSADKLKSSVRLHDPSGLPPSIGFSQVAEVTRGKVLFIAGQVPRNAAGELVGKGDYRAQIEQVFANLDTAVRAGGGMFSDVVKLNYYAVASVDPAQQRAVVEVRDRYVNMQSPPVSTFVFVSRLVHPDWLIERRQWPCFRVDGGRKCSESVSSRAWAMSRARWFVTKMDRAVAGACHRRRYRISILLRHAIAAPQSAARLPQSWLLIEGSADLYLMRRGQSSYARCSHRGVTICGRR